MRGFTAALVAAFLLSACGLGDRSGSGAPFVPEERTSSSRERTKGALRASGQATWTAREAAERITTIEKRLTRRLARWREEGRPRSGEDWVSLKILGLRAQMNYRRLAVRQRFARKVENHLTGAIAWRFHAHMKAARRLSSLTSPVEGPVKMPTTRPEHPRTLMRFYREGERRFGVPWYILASVNFIETRFGRLTGPSSAGALGPMQFMPATWDAYGRGDIMDPHDSIMAAARYLAANGAPQDMRNALWHYNHSWAYVDAIQIYARLMRAKTLNYYKYYLWQVFVRTTEGDLQLTGP